MSIIHIYKKYLTDDQLKLCFNRIVLSGQFETVFYDGKIQKTPESFIDLVRNGSLHFWEHYYTNEKDKAIPIACTWLNGLESGDDNGGLSNIHFCTYRLGHIYRDCYAHPIILLHTARDLLVRLLYAKLDGKYITQTIYATIPATNTKANKWIRLVGFQEIGVMPKRCYIQELNKNVDAIISYIDREHIKQDWRK